MGRKGAASKRFVPGAQLFMDKPEWKLMHGELQEAFIKRAIRKMRDPYRVADISRKRGIKLREGRLRRMIKKRPVESKNNISLHRF